MGFEYFDNGNSDGDWHTAANWTGVPAVPDEATLGAFLCDAYLVHLGDCELSAGAGALNLYIDTAENWTHDFDLQGYDLDVGDDGLEGNLAAVVGGPATITCEGDVTLSGSLSDDITLQMDPATADRTLTTNGHSCGRVDMPATASKKVTLADDLACYGLTLDGGTMVFGSADGQRTITVGAGGIDVYGTGRAQYKPNVTFTEDTSTCVWVSSSHRISTLTVHEGVTVTLSSYTDCSYLAGSGTIDLNGQQLRNALESDDFWLGTVTIEDSSPGSTGTYSINYAYHILAGGTVSNAAHIDANGSALSVSSYPRAYATLVLSAGARAGVLYVSSTNGAANRGTLRIPGGTLAVEGNGYLSNNDAGDDRAGVLEITGGAGHSIGGDLEQGANQGLDRSASGPGGVPWYRGVVFQDSDLTVGGDMTLSGVTLALDNFTLILGGTLDGTGSPSVTSTGARVHGGTVANLAADAANPVYLFGSTDGGGNGAGVIHCPSPISGAAAALAA